MRIDIGRLIVPVYVQQQSANETLSATPNLEESRRLAFYPPP